MKKKLKASILICLAVMVLAVPLNARIVDRIVAVVNDEIVTLSELNSAVEPYLKKIDKLNNGENREKVVAQTMSAMLDKLINDILVKQEAKRLGIVIKEEDVAKTVENVISKRNITMEDFKKALSREGSSFPAYKKEVEEHLMKIRLVGVSVKSKVSVTDEEIGDYYRKHREDYEGKEAIRIKQILIIVPQHSGMEERLKLKADAGLIHKRLMEGESFEFLANNYSNGPAAKLGGDLGFVEKGVMFPAANEVAFNLRNGEISGIIESPVGFHIIKVTDRRGAGIKSLEWVREEIKDKISNVKIEKKFFEWMGELRKKSYIEVRL